MKGFGFGVGIGSGMGTSKKHVLLDLSNVS
jgi:hypothetical protein